MSVGAYTNKLYHSKASFFLSRMLLKWYIGWPNQLVLDTSHEFALFKCQSSSCRFLFDEIKIETLQQKKKNLKKSPAYYKTP